MMKNPACALALFNLTSWFSNTTRMGIRAASQAFFEPASNLHKMLETPVFAQSAWRDECHRG
jgi:hypothetical protein